MAEIRLNKQGMLGFGDAFSLMTPQDIEDIEFIIPFQKGEQKEIFLILEDEQGLHEIIKLQYVRDVADRLEKAFKVTLNYKLALSTPKVTLKLFELEANSCTHKTSRNSLSFLLTTDKFNIAREIYIAKELGESIQAYYEKIVSMLTALEEGMKQLENEKGD